MNQKGQISFEFIIAVLIVLAIFIICLGVYSSRTSYNLEEYQKWSSKEIAFRVARNIDNAYLLDENSTITDEIIWDSEEKSVEIDGRTVKVNYLGTLAEAPILTDKVNWYIWDLNGEITYTKINGVVEVDNA